MDFGKETCVTAEWSGHASWLTIGQVNQMQRRGMQDIGSVYDVQKTESQPSLMCVVIINTWIDVQ